MSRSLLVVGVLAAAAMAELEQFPHMAAPQFICTQAPYKEYLPLSRLPRAQDFCGRRFPLPTPKCSANATTTKTQGTKVITVQFTNVAGVEKTITTGDVVTTTITNKVQPPPVFSTATVTNTTTTYVCGQTTAAPTPTTTVAERLASPTPDDAAVTTSAASSDEDTASSTSAVDDEAPTTTPDATTTSTDSESSPTTTAMTTPEDMRKRAAASSAPLKPSERSSLRARLSTVTNLANRPKGRPTASTICRCIQTNPPCSTSTSTQTVTVPRTTSYKTVEVQQIVTVNITVPNGSTLTSYATVTEGNAATINVVSSVLEVATVTTACAASSTSSSSDAEATPSPDAAPSDE